DGQYEVGYTVDVDMMKNFIVGNQIVSVTNREYSVTLTFNSADMIDDFKANDISADRKDLDDELVEYTFIVEDLDDPIDAKIYIPLSPSDYYSFTLTLDTTEIPYTEIEEETTAPSPSNRDGKD